jgi:hypothetical protein
MVSGNADGTLTIWDMPAFTPKILEKAHSGSVTSIAFAPGGKVLASGGSDQVVRLWDIATRREIKRLVGHTAAVVSVSYSSDGKTIVSAGAQDELSPVRELKLWDAVSGSERGMLTGHHYNILAARFSSKSRLLATIDRKAIHLWGEGPWLPKLRGYRDPFKTPEPHFNNRTAPTRPASEPPPSITLGEPKIELSETSSHPPTTGRARPKAYRVLNDELPGGPPEPPAASVPSWRTEAGSGASGDNVTSGRRRIAP